MPMKPADSAQSAAVDEAIRTLETAAKPARAAQRELARTWADAADAFITASFGLHNAILATAPSLLDATFGAHKTMLGAWTTAVEQQQQATLMMWRRMADDLEVLFRQRAN